MDRVTDMEFVDDAPLLIKLFTVVLDGAVVLDVVSVVFIPHPAITNISTATNRLLFLPFI